MPYGLPGHKDTPANNNKMERCVAHLVSQGKDKVTAIKICKSSLLGENKKGDPIINWDEIMKGGENKVKQEKCKECGAMVDADKMAQHMKDKHGITVGAKKVDEPAPVVAPETPVVEQPVVEAKPEEVPPVVETKPEEVKPEEVKPVEPVVETPAVVPPVETPVVETPVVEPKVETPAVETPVVEAPVVETPVVVVEKELDPIAVLKSISEMEDAETIKESIKAALKQLTRTNEAGEVKQASNVAIDVVKILGAFQKQLDNIEALAKLAGEAKKDPETVAETPVGEAPKVEVSPEASAVAETPKDTPPTVETPVDNGLAKIEKVEAGFEKLEGAVAILGDSVKKLTGMVEKIYNSPTVSRIQSPAVVNKSFEVDEKQTSARLTEIKDEVAKLEEVRKNDFDRYQREHLGDKAYQLIVERDRLNAGI